MRSAFLLLCFYFYFFFNGNLCLPYFLCFGSPNRILHLKGTRFVCPLDVPCLFSSHSRAFRSPAQVVLGTFPLGKGMGDRRWRPCHQVRILRLPMTCMQPSEPAATMASHFYTNALFFTTVSCALGASTCLLFCCNYSFCSYIRDDCMKKSLSRATCSVRPTTSRAREKWTEIVVMKCCWQDLHMANRNYCYAWMIIKGSTNPAKS